MFNYLEESKNWLNEEKENKPFILKDVKIKVMKENGYLYLMDDKTGKVYRVTKYNPAFKVLSGFNGKKMDLEISSKPKKFEVQPQKDVYEIKNDMEIDYKKFKNKQPQEFI